MAGQKQPNSMAGLWGAGCWHSFGCILWASQTMLRQRDKQTKFLLAYSATPWSPRGLLRSKPAFWLVQVWVNQGRYWDQVGGHRIWVAPLAPISAPCPPLYTSWWRQSPPWLANSLPPTVSGAVTSVSHWWPHYVCCRCSHSASVVAFCWWNLFLWLKLP